MTSHRKVIRYRAVYVSGIEGTTRKDQILKCRLSSKWGDVKEAYDNQNDITGDSRAYTKSISMTKTIKSLLDYTLNLWSDRCDTLHSTTHEEVMKT